MTLDEAIEHYEKVAEMNDVIANEAGEENWTIMFECQKCAEEHKQLAEWLKDYKRLREQPKKHTEERTKTHACVCISREAAFDEIIWNSDNGVIDARVAIEALRNLPPVEPERKTGKWIPVYDDNGRCHNFRCSACNSADEHDSKFCPNCGAKMEVDA